MVKIDESAVRAKLDGLIDPASGKAIAIMGPTAGITLDHGAGGTQVIVALHAVPAQAAAMEPLRRQAEIAIGTMPGVSKASVILTAHRQPGVAAPPPRVNRQISLPDIRFMIAVASGKGGVGKSTTAVNLALALAAQGLSVGLLDGDIYGPSIPRMLGITAKPEVVDKKFQPIMAHGVKLMSIGFMVAEDSPMIWRGPMVQGALMQMLRDVSWGALDIMVIDLPPGTGDAQLTLAQQVPLAGAVIVSTPQDIALLDARKGLGMFRRVDVPVLGIIENMSYFTCPHCQGRSEIFAHGGARQEAARLGCDFLGEIPLELSIRQSMDDGRPVTVSQPASEPAKIYHDIAELIWAKLSAPSAMRQAPKIMVE